MAESRNLALVTSSTEQMKRIAKGEKELLKPA
jgi:hypothetical protein